MQLRKSGTLDFKKFHPSVSLRAKLKTAEDLMVKWKKIPLMTENIKMKTALQIMNAKKLGIWVVRNKKKLTVGIVTDGDLKRKIQKYKDIKDLKIKNVMTKNPLSIDSNEFAARALNLMNSNQKKITNLCVYTKDNKTKTIVVIHLHQILENNII